MSDKPRTVLRACHFIPIKQERQPDDPAFKNLACLFSYLNGFGHVTQSLWDSVFFTIKWKCHQVP